ncbi:MAG: hypothetical protein J7K73_02980 [Nanoarchaeota archaeon]|nr:hypothetical protein [Nanoarchaeota archaeon]
MGSLEDILNETFSNTPLDFLRKVAVGFLARRLNDDQREILYEMLEKYKEARVTKTASRESKRDIKAISNFIWDGIAYLWRKPLWGLPGFDNYMNALDTTSKAGSVSIWRWDYVKDEGDYWQTPEETYDRVSFLKQFQGDCDDEARFLLCGLNRNGHRAYMYTMWDNQSGHATCAVEEGGTIETVGTFHRIDHITADREKVANYWYPNLKGMVIYEQDPYTFELKPIAFIKGSKRNHTTKSNLKKLEAFIAKMSKIDKNFASYVLQTLDEPYVKELERRLKKKGINV